MVTALKWASDASFKRAVYQKVVNKPYLQLTSFLHNYFHCFLHVFSAYKIVLESVKLRQMTHFYIAFMWW